MHPRDMMLLNENEAAQLSSVDFEFALEWYRRGVMAEREACANLCDDQAEKDRAHQDAGNQPPDYRSGYTDGSGDCGHTIRARSNAELRGDGQAQLDRRPA